MSCGDGSKGRRLYDWLLLDPGSHVSGQHLLLVRRSISQPSELAYSICHFSRPVPVAELVHLARASAPSKQCAQALIGAAITVATIRWGVFGPVTAVAAAATCFLVRMAGVRYGLNAPRPPGQAH